MPRQLEFFPDVAIALNAEILNHPKLMMQLREMEHQTPQAKLAHIATYCNVFVDGAFDDKGLEALFELLLRKLKEKGAIHLIVSH